MNHHDREAAAIQKRVEAAIEYEKRRRANAKDGYQCYLVYSRIR